MTGCPNPTFRYQKKSEAPSDMVGMTALKVMVILTTSICTRLNLPSFIILISNTFLLILWVLCHLIYLHNSFFIFISLLIFPKVIYIYIIKLWRGNIQSCKPWIMVVVILHCYLRITKIRATKLHIMSLWKQVSFKSRRSFAFVGWCWDSVGKLW